MAIRGLSPERTARLEALVDECRPLLVGDGGMATVQRLLSQRRVEVLDAVVITRELLGAGPTSLAQAKTIVVTSSGRGRELWVHEQFMDGSEQNGARPSASDDRLVGTGRLEGADVGDVGSGLLRVRARRPAVGL
jgi:hypothetical protein